MSAIKIEDRVSVLEAEVAQLKNLVVPPDGKDWLTKMDGSFKDEPAFDDVVRYGQEIRQADRPLDDSEA